MSSIKPIRNFIYMDSDRLNSLYSQVFDGFAEAIIESNSYTKEMQEENQQKMKARAMQERLGEYTTTTESKVLYDHMYNQLEKNLDSILYDCNNINLNNYKDELANKPVIKICGKAEVKDYDKLIHFFDNYNALGEVIAYSSIDKADVKGAAKSIKDTAKILGLYQNPTLLKNLKFMTQLFYNNAFHMEVKHDEIRFRCILNKNFLRINESLLGHLYTSYTTSPITIVGEVTYIPSEQENTIRNEDGSIQSAYDNMFRSMSEVEGKYIETQEVIINIAPIAIYTEQYIEV